MTENEISKIIVEAAIDIVVEEKVVIEVKAVEVCHSIFESQLLTCLRQTGKNSGSWSTSASAW